MSQRTRLTGLPLIGMVRLSKPDAVILMSGVEVGLGETLTEGWVLTEVAHEALT